MTKIQITNHSSFAPSVMPRQSSGDVRRAHELNVSKREMHLVNTVNTLGLETNWRPQENDLLDG